MRLSPGGEDSRQTGGQEPAGGPSWPIGVSTLARDLHHHPDPGGLLRFLGLLWRARSERTDVPRPWANRSGIGNGLNVAIWVASLVAPAPARSIVWVAGMALFMATPVLAVRAIIRDGYRMRFFHPGPIRERYGLFTIIVLGESLLAVASGTAGSACS